MRVVLLSARKRNAPEDQELVKNLVTLLLNKYPQLKVYSGSCDRGVGKILKNLCLPEEKGPKPPAQFKFIEDHIRVYLPKEPKEESELTQTEFAEIFSARNAYFNEIGEEFHLFTDRDGPRGMILDLYNRVRARNAAVALYRPGEVDPKPAFIQSTKRVTQ